MSKNTNQNAKNAANDLLVHQATLDNVSAYIFMKDLEGKYTYANQMVRDLFQCTLDEIIGKDDSSFFSLEDSNELIVNDRIVLEQGISIEKEEKNIIMETGEVRYYWSVKKPIFDELGVVIGLSGISTDITEQKQMEKRLRESERQLNTIINHIDAYIYMKDREGRFLFVNDKTADLFGLSASDVRGRLSRDFLPQEMADNFDVMDKEIVTKGEKIEGEEKIEDSINGDKYYWSTKIPIKSEDGEVESFVGFSTEITKIVEEKKELEAQALTDELTGLANRRHFMSMAYQKQRIAIHQHTHMSVMMIDLDFFKKINDKFGHPVGDIVLKKVALELSQNVRKCDLVARIGGEEFAILLPNTPIAKARLAAETLRMNIEALHIAEIDDGQTRLTASIGLASCALILEGVGKALINADEALYRAKRNGRNQVSSFLN